MKRNALQAVRRRWRGLLWHQRLMVPQLAGVTPARLFNIAGEGFEMARQALLHLVRGYQQSSLGTPPPHQVSVLGCPGRGRGWACCTSVCRKACCGHSLYSLETPPGLQHCRTYGAITCHWLQGDPRMSLQLHAVTPVEIHVTARRTTWLFNVSAYREPVTASRGSPEVAVHAEDCSGTHALQQASLSCSVSA